MQKCVYFTQNPFENAGNQLRLYMFYVKIKMFFQFRLPKERNAGEKLMGVVESNCEKERKKKKKNGEKKKVTVGVTHRMLTHAQCGLMQFSNAGYCTFIYLM